MLRRRRQEEISDEGRPEPRAGGRIGERRLSNRSLATMVNALDAESGRGAAPALRGRELSGRERSGVPRPVAALARIHTGPAADMLARRMATIAFTVDRDVVLSRSASEGSRARTDAVLRHELTHVAQHGRSGTQPVDPPVGARGGRAEREAGLAVATGRLPEQVTAGDTSVHRWEDRRTTTQHPVTEGPLEALPTDLDPGTERRLARFAELVAQEVEAWRAYRASLTGELPGESLLETGRDLQEDLFEGAVDGDRMRLYLALQLGSKRLYLLREMLSFWCGETTRGREDEARQVGELFGVSAPDPGHHYTIDGTTELSGKIGVGGSLGHARISYRNDLGMSFSVRIVMANVEAGLKAKLKAPAGKIWRKIKDRWRRWRGKSPRGGGGGGGAPSPAGDKTTDVEVGTSTSDFVGEASDPPRFWAPSHFGSAWYRPARFGLVDVSPKAAVKAEGGNATVTLGGVKYQVWKQLRIFGSWTSKDLAFDLALTSTGWSLEKPALEAKKETTLVPDVDVEAGLFSVGYGLAWRTGGADVSAPELPEPERRFTGRWVELLRSSVFFDTGQSALEGGENATVAHVAEEVSAFWEDYPEYDLKIRITGHASPRWRHPKRGEIRHDLNLALSEERAEATREQLSNAIRAGATSGSCDFEIQSCAGDLLRAPDPTSDLEAEGRLAGEGDLEALAEAADPDDDWWGYRRADIVILRTEIGIATHEPGPLPALDRR